MSDQLVSPTLDYVIDLTSELESFDRLTSSIIAIAVGCLKQERFEFLIDAEALQKPGSEFRTHEAVKKAVTHLRLHMGWEGSDFRVNADGSFVIQIAA